MVIELIKVVLNLFDMDTIVVKEKTLDKDDIIYYHDSNLEIKINQNINYKAYIPAVADEQETITTVNFKKISDEEPTIEGILIFKNEIVFNYDYTEQNYNILNNVNNIYAEINQNNQKVIINPKETTFHYEDEYRWLMINKTGNGMINNLLGTYFIKKLTNDNKLFLNVNINPQKIIFSKYCAKDIFEEHPSDCFFKIDPNLDDANGIFKTNETISNYFPEYYDELNEIMSSFDHNIIPKLLSLTSILSDKEFKALYNFDRYLSYKTSQENINKTYKLQKD